MTLETKRGKYSILSGYSPERKGGEIHSWIISLASLFLTLSIFLPWGMAQNSTRVCTKTIDVTPGDRALQKAVDAAPATGACLNVAGGLYPETVTIQDKSLVLIGTAHQEGFNPSTQGGTSKTRIQGTLIVVWTDSFATLSPDPVELRVMTLEKGPSIGLYATGKARVLLTQSSIIANSSYGLYAELSSQVTLDQSSVTESESTGILAKDSSRIVITNSAVSENKDLGILADDSSQLLLTDALVSANQSDGIRVSSHAHQGVILNHTNVVGNQGRGIFASDSSDITLNNSTVSVNEWSGIIAFDSTQITLNKTHVLYNGASKATFDSQGKPKFLWNPNCRDNDNANPQCNGIEVHGDETVITLQDSDVRLNHDWGITLFAGLCGFTSAGQQAFPLNPVTLQGKNTLKDNSQGGIIQTFGRTSYGKDTCLPVEP